MSNNKRIVLGYIIPLLAIIFYANEKEDKLAKFHYGQAFMLCIAYIVLGFAIAIPVGIVIGVLQGASGGDINGLHQVLQNLITWGLRAGYIILVILGARAGYNNEKYEIPVIGNIVDGMIK